MQIQIDAKIIKEPLLDKSVEEIEFEIVLSKQFPLSSPKLYSISNVLNLLKLVCNSFFS